MFCYSRIPASSIFKNIFTQRFYKERIFIQKFEERLGKKILSSAGFSTTAMPPPKALFKLLSPEAPWDRIPLTDVEYVTDLRKAIKTEASPLLDGYSASHLIIKATKKIKDADQAKELDPEKDLAAVLKDFQVEISAKESVPQLFADNIRLFVNTLAGK